MLSLFTKKIKYQSQKIYDDYIFSLDLSTCSCSCGATGHFVMHGSYSRSIKTPARKKTLTITRVKCKSCGKTHAILHPSIVPYSQIVLEDTISIILNCEVDKTNKNILNDNPEITQSDMNYTIKKFKDSWKDRIISIASDLLDFLMLDDLQRKVSKSFNLAFMQIKRVYYMQF